MRRKNIVVGNWKMNPTTEKEAEKIFKSIVSGIDGKTKTEVVICSPSIYIKSLRKISLGRRPMGEAKKISLGAQNSSWKDKGAFTGEISANMLVNLGVKYVILGHSERRAIGEDNSLINKKIKASISAGLLPILCVGEIARDKEHGYFSTVEQQVKECLVGIPRTLFHKIIVAYEPVWAISTTLDRRDATPADSLEMTLFIRKILADMSSLKIAGNMRIIYGGSVNDKDADGFIREGGADGLLPGRASLDPKKFLKIIKLVDNV